MTLGYISPCWLVHSKFHKIVSESRDGENKQAWVNQGIRGDQKVSKVLFWLQISQNIFKIFRNFQQIVALHFTSLSWVRSWQCIIFLYPGMSVPVPHQTPWPSAAQATTVKVVELPVSSARKATPAPVSTLMPSSSAPQATTLLQVKPHARSVQQERSAQTSTRQEQLALQATTVSEDRARALSARLGTNARCRQQPQWSVEWGPTVQQGRLPAPIVMLGSCARRAACSLTHPPVSAGWDSSALLALPQRIPAQQEPMAAHAAFRSVVTALSVLKATTAWKRQKASPLLPFCVAGEHTALQGPPRSTSSSVLQGHSTTCSVRWILLLAWHVQKAATVL